MAVLANVEQLIADTRERALAVVQPARWPGLLRFVRDQGTQLLTAPELLRATTFALRHAMPVLRLGDRVFVNRFADVLEVLENPDYFGVVPIYRDAMVRSTGDFILGMDDPKAYEHEARFLQAAVRPDDMGRIKSLIARRAAILLDAGESAGSIDAATGYAHELALTLVQEYFGVKGPDVATMTRWMRTIFWDLFLNLDQRVDVTQNAVVAARELNPYLEQKADEIRSALASDTSVPDTFFVRLVASQAAFGIDDHGVRRNIAGIIVGAVDTLSKAIVNSLDQLLRRPAELAMARAAAAAGNDETVAAYAFEALRFNPHNPIIIRHAHKDFRLARGTPRETRVRAGSTVYAGTLSAMFDASVLRSPHQFRVDRPWQHYVHFGRGMHRCFGERINRVVLPQAIKALLLRPKLRRSHGLEGHIEVEGPFPSRMIVQV